jgi:hypothetical protein
VLRWWSLRVFVVEIFLLNSSTAKGLTSGFRKRGCAG